MKTNEKNWVKFKGDWILAIYKGHNKWDIGEGIIKRDRELDEVGRVFLEERIRKPISEPVGLNSMGETYAKIRETTVEKGKKRWKTGKELVKEVTNKNGILNYDCGYKLLMGHSSNNTVYKTPTYPNTYKLPKINGQPNLKY